MKNTSLIRQMILTLSIFALSAPLMAQVHVPEGFLSDYDKAAASAKSANKPIYIHFTTDWCGWCRKIESETYPDPAVRKAMSNFVAVSLDCTNESSPKVAGWLAMMRRFGGGGFPTLAMVTPDGELLNTVGGYVPPQVLTGELAKASAMWAKLVEFRKYAASADRESLEYNLKAMEVYSQLGNAKNAAAAARKIIALDGKKNASGKLAAAHLAILGEIAETGIKDEKARKQQEIHLGEVARLDPKNKKSQLSESLLLQVQSIFASQSPKSVPADLVAAADSMKPILKLLDGLTVKNAAQRARLQMITANTGLMYSHAHEDDKAIAMLNDAARLLPESAIAEQIRGVVQQIKSHEH